MKLTPTRLLTLGAAVAALSLAACQRQEEKAAEAPAAPAAEAPPAQAAAPPEQQLAAGPVGNCYDTSNCTPAGNPPPGWGIMTQAACKAAAGALSWREVNASAQEVGSCIAPP